MSAPREHPPTLSGSTSRPGEPAPGGPRALPAASPPRRRGLLSGLSSALTEPRWVSERPPSLLDHLAYARRGEWTGEIDGPARHAALVHAWLVAIPVTVLAYAAIWATARPGRFVSLSAVFLLVTTALGQVPAVAWFIPHWALLTSWPPISWLV